jgi:hypothetical protein
MTTADPRVLDLTAFDRAEIRQARPDRGDIHRLRLALDLQLDALLLTLGASAYAESRGEPEARTPWRRWLVEDLELARNLAAALLEGDGAPVPGLGGGLAHGSVESSLENLTARFESMENLLVGLLDRPGVGQAWRPPAGEALQRCRTRLGELHQHRRAAISAVAALRAPSLPGEWLG